MHHEYTPQYSQRFWLKVDKNGEVPPHCPELGPCWLWQAFIRPDGYGMVGVGKRTLPAHRVAWELANGFIPDALHVLHHCDNPACVNPAHLFLGTNATNVADRHRKGRTSQARRNTGSAHPNSKLTEHDVREMRRRKASGESVSAIAQSYGIHRETARYIISGKRWTHVE